MTAFSRHHEKLEAGSTRAYYVDSFLGLEHYNLIKSTFQGYLDKGLYETYQPKSFVKSRARAHKGTESYSAYVCNPGTILPDPFKIFASREFQHWVSDITGVTLTEDFSFSMHHHPPLSPPGWIHNDYEMVNARKADSNSELNIIGSGHSYQGAPIRGNGFYSVTRSIALLFYLDDHWRPGDGGETLLFDEKGKLANAFRPTGNTLAFFEVSPTSYHTFAGRNKHPRNALVMWFHSACEERFKKFRRLPGRASLDDFTTFCRDSDTKHTQYVLQQFEHLVRQDTEVKDPDLFLHKARLVSQLILKWRAPAEFAILGLPLALLSLFPTISRSRYSSIISDDDFKLAEYCRDLDKVSLWAAAAEDGYTSEVQYQDSTKSSLLMKDEVLAVTLLRVAEFVIYRLSSSSFVSPRKYLESARQGLGSRLVNRMLIDVNIDHTIRKNEHRKFSRILLTGGTSGLGKELLLSYLRSGTHCAVLCRNRDALKNEEQQFTSLLTIIECDLSNAQELEKKIACLNFSDFDLFIHSAGCADDLTLEYRQLTAQHWQTEYSVNVFSAFIIVNHLLKQRSENLVCSFISSYAGLTQNQSSSGLAIYKTSKSALNRLCESLALDFPRCLFLTFLPMPFRSRMNASAPDSARAQATQIDSLIRSALLVHSGGVFELSGDRINIKA